MPSAPASPCAARPAPRAWSRSATTDGRFAFVEVECGLDVRLDPEPEAERLTELLALAERDCFVGASLTEKPRYEWRVNGELVA